MVFGVLAMFCQRCEYAAREQTRPKDVRQFGR